MAAIRRFLLRVLSLFRQDRAESDLTREVESHLGLLEEQFRLEGMSPEDARLAARRAFGGVEQAKEHQRDARAFRWIDDLRRDFAYAWRSLRRTPAFTIAAVLTLSIGIGVTTAIYSIVDTVLVQPLPLPDADRLVTITEPEITRTMPRPNILEYREWQSRTTTLSGLAARAFNPFVIMPTREGTARLTAATVSTNYFDLLGMNTAIGRPITASDDANPDVVVLSHDTWRTYFRADPGAVGSVIELRGSLGGTATPNTAGSQGRLLTIIGVMPEGDDPDGATDYYTPIVVVPGARPPTVLLRGRLQPGVSIAEAQEEANAIGNAVRPARPATEPALTMPRFRVAALKDAVVNDIRPALQVFLTAVGVVLLIVCANVANLLLARGTARGREIAVRLALGASRARIVRQILTECLALALAGGTIGALIGAGGVMLVKRLATMEAQGVFRISFGGHLLPRIDEVGVDVRVLAVALTLAVIASVIFGLLPALQLSRGGLLQSAGTRGGGTLRRESRTRTTLVVSQMVLATVLLVGAGLLVHSFVNLSRVEKGYDPSNALAFQLVLPGEYSTARKGETVESLLAALRNLPEIEAAGFAYAGILLGLEDTVGYFVPPGRSAEEMNAEVAKPRVKSISAGYMRAMGLTLLSGREIDGRDSAAAPLAVVVNRTVARRYFGDANPVGTTLAWHPGKVLFAVEIVGVVEDVRQGRVAVPAYAEIFMDYRQMLLVQQRIGAPLARQETLAFGFLSFGARTRGNPEAVIPKVRATVRSVDANAGIDAIHTMDHMVGNSMARQRFYAVLLGVFAGIAGLLAAIGIYGVLAYSVVQRTQEIGVRMALGAERWQVMTLVLRRGLMLSAIGIAIGLAGASAGARYLRAMLFGIEALDLRTFVAVGTAFAVVALMASYFPARRATRVDPVVALRVE